MPRSLKSILIGSVYIALCFSSSDFNQLSARVADTRTGEPMNRGGAADNRPDMGAEQRDAQGRLRSIESPGDARSRDDWRGHAGRDWHNGNRGNAYYGAPGNYGVPYPIYSNENYYGNPQGNYGYDSGYHAPNYQQSPYGPYGQQSPYGPYGQPAPYGPYGQQTPYGQPAPYGQQVNPSGPINQAMNPYLQR